MLAISLPHMCNSNLEIRTSGARNGKADMKLAPPCLFIAMTMAMPFSCKRLFDDPEVNLLCCNRHWNGYDSNSSLDHCFSC